MYLRKSVNIEAMQRKFNTSIIGISEETKLNKKKEKILQIVILKKLLKWYFFKVWNYIPKEHTTYFRILTQNDHHKNILITLLDFK